MNEQNLKTKYGFDVYGRHKITQNIVESYKKDRNISKIKILDIGGQYEVLKDFLPNEEIYIVDIAIDNDIEHNVYKGDATDLSNLFEDNSFDIVTSHDVLEHIPNEKRDLFLNECYRISKDLIIVTAPFYSKEVESAEKQVQNYFVTIYNFENVWLKEHLEYGLPREELITEFVKENNLYFHKFYNNNINYWIKSYGIDFLLNYNKTLIDDEISHNFRKFYNENIFPYDFEENSYRKINIISKSKISQNLIKSLELLKKDEYSKKELEKIIDDEYFYITAKIILTVKYYNELEIKKESNKIKKLISKNILLKKVIKAKDELIAIQHIISQRRSVRLALKTADLKFVKLIYKMLNKHK